MTFKQAVLTALKKYSVFAGRASRPEFWWWVVFMIMLGAATSLAEQVMASPKFAPEVFTKNTPQQISHIISLFVFLPTLSVGIRRLHDTGRSGVWILVVCVPLLGILLLIYWFASKGEAGKNQFGPPPQRDAVLVM